MVNNLGNKETMAKNIKHYMEKHGLTATTICADLNFPMASFSDWCRAKSYPRIDKIEKMANYFGISKADLVEDHEEVGGYYINKEAADLANFMMKNPEYKVLFDASRKVKPEDIKKALRAIGLFTEEE